MSLPAPPTSRLLVGLRALPNHLTLATASHSVGAALFSGTAAALAFLAAAQLGGLSRTASISWIWAIYVVGGVATVLLALHYQIPMVVAASIPGAAIAGDALTHMSLGEAAGGFLVAGLLVFLVGVFGVGQRFLNLIPMPVILGMVAGVLSKFGLNLVRAFGDIPIAATATVGAYFLTRAVSRRVPPILVALVVALVAATATGELQWARLPLELGRPEWVMPQFRWAAMVELALPLALTVAVGNHGQVFGLLTRLGYPSPPVNAFNLTAGVTSVAVSFMGAHGCCYVAPSTGICAAPEAGPRADRYVAAVGAGILYILLGLAAPVVVALATSVSPAMMNVLGGLALLPVLQQACAGAFADHRRLGGLTAFVVTLSGITLLAIGSPFWGLLIGAAVAWTTDPPVTA